MIIFPTGFVLSPAAVLDSVSLKYPRIGYQNLANGLIPVVSSAVEGAPGDAALRPNTHEYWQGSSLPATLDVDFGAMYPINYMGIGAHNIGSSGASAEVRWSDTSGDFDSYISLPGTSGNDITTPDSVANSVTGDIDIRVCVAAVDWTPSGYAHFCAKRGGAGHESWIFRLQTGSTGKLDFEWSSDGTNYNSAISSVAPTIADGQKLWVRATLDVDNGAAGRDVKFYTSSDYDPDTGSGTWTQLGTTQTSATTTSIFNSDTQISIGMGGGGERLAGNFYCVEIRNGIGGSVVARFNANDFTSASATTVSAIPTGEVWTMNQSGSPAAALVLRRLASAVAPGTDAALLFLDTTRNARHMRLKLTGVGAVPKIGVIYTGRTLDMARPFYAGHNPITMGRETEHFTPLSRTGQFLGQLVRRRGLSTSVRFQHLTAAWVRANLDPFIKAARSAPYFFAWRPSEYPEEVAYVWNSEDIHPVNMGKKDYMEVSWNLRGLGHD